MTYDDHEHDRALDAQEAAQSATEARADAERKQWLDANDRWLRKEFMEERAELFAEYQQGAWEEYIGEAE